MRVKVLVVAEFDGIDPARPIRDQVDGQFDRFRERVEPGLNYGITLYQATLADAGEFQQAGTFGGKVGHCLTTG